MAFFDFLKKKELEEIADLKSKLEKYKPIINIEYEVSNQRDKLEDATKEYSDLKKKYSEALVVYEGLKKEISLYENEIELTEFGIYKPIYDFEKSEDYRKQLESVVAAQKNCVTAGRAAICKTNWQVNGSEAKGKANTQKFIKLMLRAFNGECDTLISKVKWNNVNQMLERMEKALETINKLGENNTVSILPEYLELKKKELILEYEYQAKKQKEKEELKAAQEELREEEKARREYEQAQREAEKEEANVSRSIEKAKKELTESSGEKQKLLLEKIAMLEKELEEAHLKKERAISMAQQTKRGHVYIISNIGSFGENVFKIGMTRRLEPLDRIRELGDASVPFLFDVHAMIFSENAPGLENELHRVFSNNKTNMLNGKKEFFNITIDDIEAKLKTLGLEIEFHKLPEAKEYRETRAIVEKANIFVPQPNPQVEFPKSI